MMIIRAPITIFYITLADVVPNSFTPECLAQMFTMKGLYIFEILLTAN